MMELIKKSMDPPGKEWPTMVQVPFVDPNFWSVRTKKSARGRNRLPKQLKERRVVMPSAEEIKAVLPGWAEIHFNTNNYPLHLSVNDLLGIAINDRSLPWKNLDPKYMPTINGESLEKNWHFSFKRRNGKRETPPLGNNVYECIIECKLDGVLRYVAMENAPLLSKWVFRLIESMDGLAQRDERLTIDDGDKWGTKRKRKKAIDREKGYFILHYVRRGDPKPPRKMAVVIYLSPDCVLLASLNDKYYTKNKDCFLLHRP